MLPGASEPGAAQGGLRVTCCISSHPVSSALPAPGIPGVSRVRRHHYADATQERRILWCEAHRSQSCSAKKRIGEFGLNPMRG